MSLYDLVIAPCWLLATVLLVRSAARVSARLHPRGDFFSRALDSLVLSWAAIVLTAFALSAFRLLVPWLLLALIGTTAAAIPRLLGPSPRRASEGADSTVADFLGAAPLFGGSVRRRDRPWLIAWLAYAALAAGAVALCGLLEFPTDWDSLAYHIPLVDQWIRAGSLNSTHSSSWFHPGNDELLGFWCVAPFSGDFLIGLENIPAVAILGLSVHQLARLLGARPAAAHLTALAALTPHVVMRQLIDGENDVAAAGVFVAALACGVRYAYVPRGSNAFLWAAAFGLLPGTKYYALGYAAVAIAGVVALTLWLRGPRRAAIAGWTALAGAALLSGYWYARNAWLTGTPLYPQGFLRNAGILTETFPYVRETSFFGKGDPSLVSLLAPAVWNWLGAAHTVAFLAIPLTSLALASGAFRRGDAHRAGARIMLAGLLWLTLGVFGATPFVVETTPGTLDMLKQGYLPSRFLLCTTTLAQLALVIVIGVPHRCDATNRPSRRCAPRWRRAALWLFAAAAISQIRLGKLIPCGGDALAVALAAFDSYLLLNLAGEIRRASPAPRRWRVLYFSALLALSLAASALGARWHNNFASFYDHYYRTQIFTTLDAGDIKAERICPLTYRSYPFLGSRRQYDVFGPVWVPTYDALRAYLATTRPDTVVPAQQEIVGPHRYDRIRDWVAADRELFEPIGNDWRFAVYRYRP